MTSALRAVLLALAVAIAALLATGCDNPSARLAAIPRVDPVDAEPAVRAALVRARAEFDRIASDKPTNAALADAYGDLAMTYHAHALLEAAEVAYSDARLLAPRDKRWPYLAGHLFNDSSRPDAAIAAFMAALALDEHDAPTLFSLGEVYLKKGDLDPARDVYRRLEADGPMRAAALAGLGKVALAKREYKEAVDDLEQSLKLAPGSARLRYPLAMAYRGLGDAANAERSLAQYAVNGSEPGVADPLANALGAKAAGSRALLRRGLRFANAGRSDLAEPVFRAAVEADATNAESMVNLGIALANLGRNDEAQERLTEGLRLDDSSALGHLSLGVVLDRQGLDERACAHYAAALAVEPGNLQALVYLADARMRLGMADEAIKLYAPAATQMRDSVRMQLSLAMANIRAGHEREARDVLESTLKALPGDPDLVNALARILSTANDSSVRDGSRALTLAKPLFDSIKSPDVGQTYAMALAETGDFEHATLLQRETIIVLERSGRASEKPFAQRNLARFERRMRARVGWPREHPVFFPRGPAVQLIKPPASP